VATEQEGKPLYTARVFNKPFNLPGKISKPTPPVSTVRVVETTAAAVTVVSGVRATDLGVFTGAPFDRRCMIASPGASPRHDASSPTHARHAFLMIRTVWGCG
jgi:hypothetical protein